jgi:hypothetical protein
MHVFRTLNSTIEKPDYTITFKNLDFTSDHWGGEKEIEKSLSQIQYYLNELDDFNKNIILHTLDIFENNYRLVKGAFYKDENDRLILFVVSDLRKFADKAEGFREIDITFKKHKFSFAIIEALEKDVKEAEKEKKTLIPATWKLDEVLTKKLIRLKGNFLDS